MQPLLLPGTRVLRRDTRHLQVGLDPDARVVLPDSPELRRLETGELLRGDAGLAARLERVLLPDDGPLRAALPAARFSSYAEPEAWGRHSLASLARQRRPDAASFARRSSYVVVVQSAEGRRRTTRVAGLAEALAEELRLLCRRSGLRVGATLPGGPRASRPPVVRALVCVGEPDRGILDEWDEPHLVVRFVEGRAVVGPFVERGTTACLRCADAHLTETDPAWPLLLEQYSRLAGLDRADGLPEPVDAALAAVALGWATRELATHAEGGTPLTRGLSLRLDPGLVDVECQDWPQRTDCGCADN
jgi:hypothetical protein